MHATHPSVPLRTDCACTAERWHQLRHRRRQLTGTAEKGLGVTALTMARPSSCASALTWGSCMGCTGPRVCVVCVVLWVSIYTVIGGLCCWCWLTVLAALAPLMSRPRRCRVRRCGPGGLGFCAPSRRPCACPTLLPMCGCPCGPAPLGILACTAVVGWPILLPLSVPPTRSRRVAAPIGPDRGGHGPGLLLHGRPQPRPPPQPAWLPVYPGRLPVRAFLSSGSFHVGFGKSS